MSYTDEIMKTELPLFAELYDFEYGEEKIYLTSYPREVTYGGRTYLPVAMSRNELVSEMGNKKELILTFAVKEEANLGFLTKNPSMIRVVFRRLFLDTKQVRTIFVGEGESIGIEGRLLVFKAIDILSSRKTLVPQQFTAPTATIRFSISTVS